ncbi:hypothetical protein ACI4A9_28785, partial [Klebsiella pneumoniae]|uniref:hypothetical protein n=1 Tax=Klebsiella pneumoniae TaxID=573 RepID=UPI00385306FE
SLALFDLASGAQRAESEEEIAAVLATHGRRALRSPEVAVRAVEAGAAPGDDALVVRLPQGAATDGSVLVAAARGTGDP